MAAPSLNSAFGGGQNVMLMRGDLGSSNSLVAMLNGFQVARSGGGLEDIACGQKRPLSYTSSYPQPAFEGGMEEGVELEDALDGEAPGQVEKKRRLSFDQVRSLEKNFELENKLEPERKMQLAKELGLQPRQVAVWFQNRRARWKTKQLERDYEMLNTGYLKLKADFEAALREKDALKAKVLRLSGKTTSHDSHSDVESSQCESEAATPDPQAMKNSSPATECKDSSKATVVTSSDGSNEDSSSELLDADSPRTTDQSNRAGSLGDDNNLVQAYCDHFPAPESFVTPGELAFPVKLEDGQSTFDTSCNYFLPPMLDSQSVLPWWDWA